MCGRVVSRVDIQGFKRITRARGSRRSGQLRRGYNIGPASHQATIVHSSSGEIDEETSTEECPDPDSNRIVCVMRWGLNNFREKNRAKPMVINIRLESMDYKFKSLHQNRCVVLAEGYYEWKDSQVFLTKPKNAELFYFAGLYRETTDGAFEYGIITMEPRESMY